ncbi:2-amino-4-hydroxy-6-hydroxymethyldihydropteridine diphosphokinase [Robertkochia solimangrovi]|uniref:2-amino-4-hydroxy-6- hydroxymethyldihydropteridine diphosphokinase n=1 Tax=Robertkochia solimangrovi TaxID=2213046 RepID=UPI00117C45FD|nr:2-amino-4-hydroxy-6-hydroxymethyldihydropteridine diphosphokinase [Robertkochia solimangrovi]TRZ44446.1 2-amino-4-hydroxy-6-hydroxymethyldihydropteridine diphosphokinase [Robertkochia solimangrovi]
MEIQNRAYISLGSNKGNRLEQLQSATEMLNESAGKVLAVSPIYQTPPWGFDSDDFLNACLLLQTDLSPEDLMLLLLEIEKKLGRVRGDQEGYQARTIDLDMLFYNDLIIDNSLLQVPHPALHKRRFVLQPLASIGADMIHPVLHQTMEALLKECSDHSELKLTPYQLLKGKRDFRGINYIAIEGNIGAGKTTLANMLSQDFQGKLILEQFADNPFLPNFYKDQDRYAFPLEMSFLAERYQQFTSDTARTDLFSNFMVSDYDINKSLIFAGVTLQSEEYRLYRRLFNIMYKEVLKPDIYVYLFQNTTRLLENIRKRGRSYEQQIAPDYLNKINTAYYNFIRSQPDMNPLIIDISDIDFVKNLEDYHLIIDKIHDFRDKNQ